MAPGVYALLFSLGTGINVAVFQLGLRCLPVSSGPSALLLPCPSLVKKLTAAKGPCTQSMTLSCHARLYRRTLLAMLVEHSQLTSFTPLTSFI